jgi:Zn-dependent protease
VILFVIILFVQPTFAVVYAGVFFMVLLHECGHCLAAQHYRTPIRSIVLYPIGGAATMEIPREPMKEFVIALAGPAVNVALIPAFMVLGSLHPILALMGYYNMVLLVFNMIPSFPMDGGRVLRASLTHFLKDHARATTIAGRVGQVIAVGFAILGITSGHFMLVVIAIFVFMAAEGEIQMSRVPRTHSTEGDVRSSAQMISSVQDRLERLNRRLEDE